MPYIAKNWVKYYSIIFISIMILLGMVVIVIDPYFHYHKPLAILSYPIDNERYQNNGIVKNYKYNAIITGSSMTECFKTSEMDELFGTCSIKVPFSGGSYKEINDNLVIAFSHNADISVVVRGLDYNRLLDKADNMRYERDKYPVYLYDENVLNDVNYIFNKEVILGGIYKVLDYTKKGMETTSFDEYSNWMNRAEFGKEAVEETYQRESKKNNVIALSENDKINIYENINENIVKLVVENPDTEFYYFFTPYSIYYWDSLNQARTLERQLEAEKYATGLMFGYENLHLFSFFDEYEMICDLNNYKDIAHYGDWVNSKILKWMRGGVHELTIENYNDYYMCIQEFYINYDYDSLFEE